MVAWLVSWLWQGCVLAFLVSVGFRFAPAGSAATRYLVWWLALLAVLLLPWVGQGAADPVDPGPRITSSPPASSSVPTPLTLPAPPEPALRALLGLWLVGATVRLLWLGYRAAALRRLKARVAEMPPARERRLRLWRRARGHGRRARLGVSQEVGVACVLGLGRPVIVLPPVLLEGLTDAELDQIVVHEHAHVQRWDDWSNLAYAAIAAVCGWHPAVWWIGRRLSLERETACDDCVVTRAGAARGYARCLAKVALMMARPPIPALVSGAAGARSQLSRRVARLMDPRRNRNLKWSIVVMGVAAGLLATTVLKLAWMAPVVTFAEPVTAAPVTEVADRSPLRTTGSALAEAGKAGTAFAAVAGSTVDDDAARSSTSEVVPEPLRASGTTLPNTSTLRVPEARPSRWFEAYRVGAAEPLPSRRLTADLVLESRASLSQTAAGGLLADLRAGRVDPAGARERTGWSRLSSAGSAIGTTFTRAGTATASAFASFGGSVKRAFTGGGR